MKSSRQGRGNGIHVQAEGPAGFTGSDGLEALGVWFYKALLRGRDGVAGVEEPRAQLGTSWGTSHEAESRLGLRIGGRRSRAGRAAGLQLCGRREGRCSGLSSCGHLIFYLQLLASLPV